MSERILITGGAGYVGATLVRRLLAGGYAVRVLDCLRWGGEPLLGAWGHPGFELVRGDVTEPAAREQALRDVQGVVHLAAVVGDPACKAEPELATAINLDATRALVSEARAAGCGSFLFASTCSNYGISDPDSLAHEDSPLNPVSLYARTKVGAEEAILGAAAPGFAPTVLRLATVYGAAPRLRFDLTVNEFAREAALGRKLVIFGEHHWRPYIHVRDVARGLEHVLKTPAAERSGQVFNLGCTEENYQKLGIYNLLREMIPDMPVEFVKTGPDPRSYRVSFEKIKSRLGFEVQDRVRDGLAEIVALVRAGLVNPDDPRWANT